MRRAPATAVFCAALAGLAPQARADVSRIVPLKSPIAVGEVITLELPGGIGSGNCKFNVDLGQSSETGFKAGVIEVSGLDNRVYNFRLPGRRWDTTNYGEWGTTVIPGVRFLSPGQYQLNVIDDGSGCAAGVKPVTFTVRDDYAPMMISVYGRPGHSAVKRLDGSWSLAPGQRRLWISRAAEADLSAMTDGYVPGTWKEIFPSGFTESWEKAGVEVRGVERQTSLSGASWDGNEDVIVLALGRESQDLADAVAAGRLAKLLEFSPEIMVTPLRKALAEAQEASRAEQARSREALTHLGDPDTLVGFRIARPASSEKARR
ncbi:MAG: hypothetical protein IM658_11085 [Phenylobacterium sp.]|jgi:hypothetical protein|uniref:hypothetical protein n=1 Tax=Phenylobacterium sp. TaxID=1871053 RepID=UPI0025F89585|nr:hypothetical protein [Phenylobacterium sp.]MCA3709943.1 hypothetical protein [Phenylobacterium sp.]MCA3711721.1 hypothetical protein [Phenylobacterium sp.]MCA3714781.1 hypothetical protein [Phenylobacterium sp.]MCA3722757.1 hypothetical protein [Phenylobacterium sp.]MCA3726522.1 hypothetical protein [Phenylobacterium sp.]